MPQTSRYINNAIYSIRILALPHNMALHVLFPCNIWLNYIVALDALIDALEPIKNAFAKKFTTLLMKLVYFT